MEQIIVEGKPREDRGKNAARRLRVSGEVPAVLYGGKGGPLALALNTKQLSALLRSESGQNTVFQVRLPSGDEPAMVKDWQVDPVKGEPAARGHGARRHGRAHTRARSGAHLRRGPGREAAGRNF